ncbi:hypothetical protein [Polaribacter sargassicola]|uniref:hypothetical protein n=1 Tax=Polaribacter sargassicola TaxID=2836891 RepID=UPI001F48251F|nr:hypothetical protein [Polaribacter sp. DS7-9]MCG1034839.1 hypothetical protein [Polaribacter sp. DS7-9]
MNREYLIDMVDSYVKDSRERSLEFLIGDGNDRKGMSLEDYPYLGLTYKRSATDIKDFEERNRGLV